MNFHLLLHNVAFLSGALVAFGMNVLVFVYSYQKKKFTNTAVTFMCMNIAVMVLQVSQVLGVNAADAVTSRNWFMFNLTNFFIQIFMTHWFLATMGKVKERRYVLLAVYVSAILGFVFFLFEPRLFMLDSVPKLYLPFFYNPGPYYIFVPSWFFVVGAYYFTELVVSYRKETDPIQKNRLKYIFLAIFYGFVVGTSDFLLVFNIPMDPFLSGLFGLYTIPLTYAIVQYELLDIRILAKRAFYFAVAVVLLSVCIGLVSYLADYVTATQPEVPKWVFYILSSLIVATGGAYAWRKVREVDIMKYQFINVITHTFRTPLTEIKWALESLTDATPTLSDSAKEAIRAISVGNSRLVELTNILVTLNDSDAKSYIYHFTDFAIGPVILSVADEYKNYFSSRKLTCSVHDEAQGATVHADEQKIKFVLRIAIENAIRYTPEGGKIDIVILATKPKIKISITDSGIGIPKSESNLIFTKFYRAKNALHANTDGSGVGLYLAKEIVIRSGGSIYAYSEGEGRGTSLTITLPNAHQM